MPERHTSRVSRWVESLRFGWLENPISTAGPEVHVDQRAIPYREGIGTRLRKGESVEFEFGEKRGRHLQAVKLSFPATDN